jgi:putative ABC transport system permease protein
MRPTWLDPVAHDVSAAIRSCRRRPALTAIVLLTLAVGMGAVTAVFSVANAVLLRPLPYRDADRLVVVWEDGSRRGGSARTNVASSNFVDWRDETRTFEGLAIVRNATLTLTGLSEAHSPLVHRVSANYFDVLGAAPLLGRTFVRGEDVGRAAPVVLLSYGLWKSRFAGDPAVVGRSLLLDDVAHTIVGVMPRDFYSVNFFPTQPELWVPLSLEEIGLERRVRRFLVIGRLKSGVTLSEAGSDLNSVAASLASRYPDTNRDWAVNPVPIRDQVVGDFRRPVVLLLLAAALVLAIACFNIANILLAQQAERSRDLAVRLSLGGSRARMFGQMLLESLVLAVGGGCLGLLVATVIAQPLASLVPAGAGVPFLDDVTIDARVATFAFVLCWVTGLLFGLVPSRLAFRTDLERTLRQDGRSSTGSAQSHRFRQGLVVAEIGLSVALVLGEGLVLRTFENLRSFDPGFRPSGVVTMTTALRGPGYAQPAQRSTFFQRVLAEVRQIPAVTAVSMISSIPPVSDFASARFAVTGASHAPGHEPHGAALRAGAGYFETLGIPIVDGRAIDERDTVDGAPVVVVSKELARRWLQGRSAVGALIRLDGQAVDRQVVGVVGDVVSAGRDPSPQPVLYVPFHQSTTAEMVLVIRVAPGGEGVAREARRRILALDRTLPVYDVRTMDDVLSEARWVSRFTMTLLGAFALLSLLLVAAGTYGVLSFLVTQRQREFAVRQALGASRRDILAMVLGRGAWLALAGSALGLAMFAWARTLLSTLLFGVSSFDLAISASAVALMVGITLLACLVPARRAMRTSPAAALRGR